MRAMLLPRIMRVDSDARPLTWGELQDPAPQADEILVRVATCGVCHTELDEIEGRTPPPRFPVIPGHQIVGHVESRGAQARRFDVGERVGVAWIFSACGACHFCKAGNENLCREFRATGRDAHGGYAERMCVPEAFAHPIPERFSDTAAAPLLCAGAIGYRALRLAVLEDGRSLGLTGFGASAHLVLQMARFRYPNSRVFVFARSPRQRRFARDLGATWAGDTEATSPETLASVIDTTPAWKPVVAALASLEPGGRLVINAIRKESGDAEALRRLDYARHLWMEKEIKSVANVTRNDVREFLDLAAKMQLEPEVEEFALEDANEALLQLKQGQTRGAKVLRVRSS
ncbi:MAG: zinc-dependent alcohol dehydrogenase family protein [Candidatus Latescibacterota bacterium]|nr:MAG: zinc-dependent alcohol dehydrogenase family protein [Candidatus Latescibacterota bacterium]